MDEESAYHFILGSFILLLAFNHFFPGAQITQLMTWAVAFLSIGYIVKGFIVSIFGGEYETFWAGCAIALMLIIFFNGLPIFETIVNRVLGHFGAALVSW